MKPTKLIPIIVCVSAFVTVAQFAGAQTPDNPSCHHGPPNLTTMLTRTLQLTDAQKSQVEPLVTAVRAAARGDSSKSASRSGRDPQATRHADSTASHARPAEATRRDGDAARDRCARQRVTLDQAVSGEGCGSAAALFVVEMFHPPGDQLGGFRSRSKRERFAASFLDLNQPPGATRHRRCVPALHLKVRERSRSSPRPASWWPTWSAPASSPASAFKSAICRPALPSWRSGRSAAFARFAVRSPTPSWARHCRAPAASIISCVRFIIRRSDSWRAGFPQRSVSLRRWRSRRSRSAPISPALCRD